MLTSRRFRPGWIATTSRWRSCSPELSTGALPHLDRQRPFFPSQRAGNGFSLSARFDRGVARYVGDECLAAPVRTSQIGIGFDERLLSHSVILAPERTGLFEKQRHAAQKKRRAHDALKSGLAEA